MFEDVSGLDDDVGPLPSVGEVWEDASGLDVDDADSKFLNLPFLVV